MGRKRKEETLKNTIVLRNDGRYQSQITTCTGKRKTFYGKSKEEVKRKVSEFMKLQNTYEIQNIPDMNFENYLINWAETKKKPVLKPKSFLRIQQIIQCQINNPDYGIGYYKLRELTPRIIQEFITTISKNYSYSTTKKTFETLNACLKYAVLIHELPDNPAVGTVIPKNQEYSTAAQNEISYYTDDEVKLIVKEALRKHNGKYVYQYGFVIVALLNTGLRIGEILAANVHDVSFEKKQIYICSNISEYKKQDATGKFKYTPVEQSTPKTKNSVRYVPLNKHAEEAFRFLISQSKSEKVITTKNGTTPFQNRIYNTMKRIIKKCNIPPRRGLVHALRHTFVSQLIRNGVDIKTVSLIAGHSSTQITADIYYHILEKQKHSAVASLPNFY